jgi:threonylcarbamoyladenosine tRNA methylthiotransferase MtaB
MPEVDEVLPDEASVQSFLARHGEALTGAARRPWFGERTRAYLKVQEGCGFPCTYCIVPSVRGPSRSVPAGEILEGFKSLLDAGYKEIVLTGINTGEYGKDLAFRGGLPALLERLLKTEGRYRIRLNSVEPKAVTPGLISLVQREAALAKHLQIPLQSGSDRVLRAMRRNYRSASYSELIRRLAEEIPGIGLGADVLAGYPTETSVDFRSTLALIESAPLAFLHAFSYSPRPGTPAAQLTPLEPQKVHSRTNALRALGERKKATFASGLIGKSLDALTLVSGAGKGRALTTNFLDVELDHEVDANAFVKVKVTSVSEGRVTARVEAEPGARR